MQVVLLGTAGSGKTSLTITLQQWLKEKYGFSVRVINLDPGAENVTYTFDYDIRRMVSVRDLMIKENLGPNGATLKAMEIIQRRFSEVEVVLSRLQEGADVIIYDTPGQMEVFVFHPSGPFILNKLRKIRSTVGVFLVDPWLLNSPSGLAAALLLSVITKLRMSVPIVLVVSKSDLVNKSFVSKLVSEPDFLAKEIEKEDIGTLKDVASELVKLIANVPWVQRLIFTSALSKDGLDELYSLLHEAFCTCGDLT
ncbi:MAG: ATP/GTP-binding protein [Thermoproteota archaeon]